MTHTNPAPRDRAADFSDAVVASYIHEISTRNGERRFSSAARRDRHSGRRHARSAEGRARGAERVLQQ